MYKIIFHISKKVAHLDIYHMFSSTCKGHHSCNKVLILQCDDITMDCYVFLLK